MTYKEQINELWNKAGGLITKRTAAKILQVNPSVISKRIKNGSLRSFQIEEDEFLSLQEILKRDDIKPRKTHLPQTNKQPSISKSGS